MTAHFAIDARIALRIVASQQLPGPYAFPGQPKLAGKQSSQLRRVRSRTGAAQHVVSSIPAQGDGRPARSRDELRPVCQQLQRCIEITLRHLGQGSSGVFAGEGGTPAQWLVCPHRGKRRRNAGLWIPGWMVLLQNQLQGAIFPPILQSGL